jgi:hypothetical protein
MTCENAFTRYLELDKHERVPLSVTIHLFLCPACRTAVRKLTRAESLLARPLAVPAYQAIAPDAVAVDPVVAAALERIAASGLGYVPIDDPERHVSMNRWLVSGIAMIAGFAVIPFTMIGSWSGTTFGNSFSVPFYILCGVAVTLYCGCFIGSNIDFFVKKFGFRHSV